MIADILNARILIVDDEKANVQLLEGILRVAGYTSVQSTNYPDEVCELHRKNRYSLILLDLHMPGMDGFQVMEGLRKIEPDGYLPVLVITAHPDYKLRAVAAGAKDFVSKPFDMSELRTRVHNILEVRLLQQFRNLAAHLLSVREEERARISREVHDELGQSLTAVKMDLAWLAARLPRGNAKMLKRIRSTGQLADSIIQSVRRISTELRPAVLDLGLAAAVEWQVQEFQARSGVQCKVRLLVRGGGLSRDL